MLKKYRHLLRFIYHAARHQGGLLRLLRKVWAIYRLEGLAGLLRRLPLRRQQALDAARFRKNTYHARELIADDFTDLNPSGGIAVIAHVYYPELFEQMVEAMANIPWAFDLCVSVIDREAEAAVRAQAERLQRVRRLDIRIVPNRGRDIAPFLVEFADVIARHRYVLHLHSKKSMYSGRERTEWRDYLFEGLLGSERRIRQIFHLLSTNAEVGIVYPDTFEGVPYWAHTWLQNRGIAYSLAARMGIDIEYRRYVDAPMGSMFWARSDALQPLRQLKLSIDDFPEECGQTDGTLQHAIERLFVPAAHHAGFSQRVMLDAGDGATLFLSPGRKNLQHYFAVGARERILATGAGARIVSFDIFDTLLVRPWFSPGNLFAYLDQAVESRFGIAEFSRLRLEAEQLARLESQGGDVRIDAIYEAFGRISGRPEHSVAVRMLEEASERALLQPRADICEAARALKAAGKRIVLVSDMYLGEDFLRELLHEKGLDFFDAIYVSSETGLRKDRGDLWAEIARREGVAPEDWRHIGDDEHSDVQRPLDAGYAHPVHVMRATDQFLLFNEEAKRWIRPCHWQEGLLLGLLANRLFLPDHARGSMALSAEGRTVEIGSLHDFGYVTIGPALAVFMAWLLKEARADGVSLLLYASREGHLLKQAHDLIATRLDVPAGEYFLCSRRAAGFAALKDEASVEVLLKAHFRGSLADLLQKRFGIDDLAPFAERLGVERLTAPGELPESTEAYRAMLLECHDLLTGMAGEERARYLQYAQPLIGTHRAALVDVGYSATIQKALSRFMEGIHGGYYFVTVEQSADVDGLGQFAKGCFGHRINGFHADLPIYQFSLLLEAVLTAPHGQLLGFDEMNGELTPRYRTPGLAQRHFADIETIHQGALEYLRDVLDVAGEFFENLGQHHGAANLPIRQVMEYRWKLAVDTPALHVEDAYSGNEEISIFEFYDRKRERLPGVCD